MERGAALLLEGEVLPGPAPVPDFATLVARRLWRSRLLATCGVLAATAVVGAVTALLIDERAPVSYVVAGEAGVVGDQVEARPSGSGETTRVRFSEGTEVTLQPGAKLGVVERTGRGAVLALERGQARFSVVHRRGARWSVVAGPFVVEVTGTEFTVGWSPREEKLVVDLWVGAVRIAGTSVGGAVELHAGERLVATAADHRVTLSPSGDAPSGAVAGAPVTMTTAAPHAPPAPSRIIVDGSWSRSAVALSSPGDGGQRGGGRTRIELPELFEPPVPSLDGAGWSSRARGEGPRIAPAPETSPAVAPVPQSLTIGGGGLFCVTVPAQYSFEDAANGISVPRVYTLAFSRPRIDRTHSWCGESSVRVDAAFDDGGRRNFFGRFADETGQVLVRLEHATDLTGKTVTMHFFVEGPADARFSAELAAVERGGWVSSPAVPELGPGRWWTVSHRFGINNPTGVPGSSNPLPFPNGGSSSVVETDRLSLAIHSTGARRAWRGAIYVDDISWK
jgi:hypothetical protein